FRPSETWPPGHSLRDPRAHWSGVARKRLDGSMAELPADGAKYRKAKAVLRGAPSFEDKCHRFFDHAAADLDALAALGVRPHVAAAGFVFYAWDWTIPDHSLLHPPRMQAPKRWEERWQTLQEAVMVLKSLQYVALQADLADGAPHAPGSNLAVRVEDVARELVDLRAELMPVVAALQSAP